MVFAAWILDIIMFEDQPIVFFQIFELIVFVFFYVFNFAWVSLS